MAWVYTMAGLHVPLGSFTADPCVVYSRLTDHSHRDADKHTSTSTALGSIEVSRQGSIVQSQQV